MTDDIPEITTIIPAHNRHAELQRAVASALDQTIDRHEVIVVDDGSVPPIRGTDRLCDSRVRIIRSTGNNGAAAARNMGIAAARASIIAFLDSDDTWLPTKLQEQLALIDGAGLHGIVTGFNISDAFKSRSTEVIPDPVCGVFEFARGCWFSPGTTLLIRKAAFETIGLFDPTLRRLEDYEWFLRFGLAGGKLSVVPRVLANIDVSLGGRPDAVKAAARVICHSYDGRLPKRAQARVKAFTALAEASAHLRAGRPLSAALPFLRSLAAVPRMRVQLQSGFA